MGKNEFLSQLAEAEVKFFIALDETFGIKWESCSVRLSESQRRSIWVWCGEMAEALNDAGFDMKTVLEKKSVDVSWSKETVKSVLFDPIMEAMTEKTSSTDLDTTEPDRIINVLNRHLATNFGVSVPFPEKEK